ncbi:MAG: Rne/Rng family ribonuclease, partial [Woeseiaceae bacterium]|nr:Rne/Rng family ribonuclease [Woeseiaceae bacterium]
NMKRMLINATQQEELRMAMVDGQRLYDLNIEAPASERKKANIYLGKITRIEPSLEAAFVDYGAERHGFLPLKEISSEYFSGNKGGGKPNIREVLKEGQSIVVQVDKEERGNKGAALTTFVSLAGRFIVLKPNKARSGGVSRRITGQDRDAARKALNSIEMPDGMSVILRTAGIDRTAEELAWDLENLLTVWTAILNVVLEKPAPFLIYRESDSVVRALRDYLTNEIGEILIDDEQTYKDAYEHVETTMPHNLKKLKHYTDPVPLFTRFQIESQIESAFAHTVNLPSGGSIVIDHTEALVSIDINSARATKGGDIEATALNTNLEAAEEIARQLRIRDLGGLIVIDFIDMGPSKHQRDVENRLREAVRQDRARVQIGKISRFGLLEMSRQRLRPSIGESAHMTCPRCSGFGNIRSVESLALAILRIVGEEARKERTAKVIAQLPVEVSTYLLNEKRDWVQNLEDSNDTQIVLVANPLLETPHYEVRRVRDDQTELPENAGVSYELADSAAEPEAPQAILERKQIEAPAVGTLKPTKPAPKREKPKGKGLLETIASWFGGDEKDEKKSKSRRKKSGQPTRGRRSQQSKRRSDGRGAQRKKTQKKSPQKQQQAKKKTTRKTDPRRKPAQKDRQQKAKQPRQDKSAAQDESREEQKRTSRNRRSRGGRRRRRSAPDQAGDTQAQDKQQQEQTQAAATQTKSKPAQQSAQEGRKSGPPRARTDAERAADASKLDDTASRKALVTDKDAKPDAERKPRPARKPRSDEATKAKPADKPQAESKPESEKKPRAESKPKTEPKPKAESKPRAGQKSRAESKPEVEPKPKAESKPKAEPKPKADGNGSDQPKGPPKLLPWEPQSPPVVAKEPAVEKPAKPKAEAPAAKPDVKPAESGPDQG